jgi:hypothetical protein
MVFNNALKFVLSLGPTCALPRTAQRQPKRARGTHIPE